MARVVDHQHDAAIEWMTEESHVTFENYPINFYQ